MKSLGSALLSASVFALLVGVAACDGASLSGNTQSAVKKDESGGDCAKGDHSCIAKCEKAGKSDCSTTGGPDNGDTGTTGEGTPTGSPTTGEGTLTTGAGTAGPTDNATVGATGTSTSASTGPTGNADGDDPLSNTGEATVKLVDDMTILQLQNGGGDADDDFTIRIQKIDPKTNTPGAVMQHDFSKHNAETWVVPDMCTKIGDNAFIVHFVDRNTHKDMTISGNSQYVQKTGGAPNAPEITADDGNCLFGSCVDPGSDNTFRFSCPAGQVLIQ